jgi:hypothetical protein
LLAYLSEKSIVRKAIACSHSFILVSNLIESIKYFFSMNDSAKPATSLNVLSKMSNLKPKVIEI